MSKITSPSLHPDSAVEQTAAFVGQFRSGHQVVDFDFENPGDGVDREPGLQSVEGDPRRPARSPVASPDTENRRRWSMTGITLPRRLITPCT